MMHALFDSNAHLHESGHSIGIGERARGAAVASFDGFADGMTPVHDVQGFGGLEFERLMRVQVQRL